MEKICALMLAAAQTKSIAGASSLSQTNIPPSPESVQSRISKMNNSPRFFLLADFKFMPLNHLPLKLRATFHLRLRYCKCDCDAKIKHWRHRVTLQCCKCNKEKVARKSEGRSNSRPTMRRNLTSALEIVFQVVDAIGENSNALLQAPNDLISTDTRRNGRREQTRRNRLEWEYTKVSTKH